MGKMGCYMILIKNEISPKKEANMKSVNVKRIRSLLSGCFVTLFLFSLFLGVPVGKASAQSMKEHTAKLVEGAKKEGKVVFYTSMDIEDSTALLKRFAEKYPFIKTELYRAGGLRLVSKILAEFNAKKYNVDVTMNSGINTESLKKEGLHAKYLSPESKFYPKGSVDPEGYWTDTYVNYCMIVYNTDLVSPQDVPKAWADLADPKWKGKMGMPDMAVDWFYGILQYMGEEKGMEFMKKLGEQEIQFQRGRTLLAQLVAAGEISLVPTLYPTHAQKMKEKGAPVSWVAVDPVIPLLHPISVCAHAPHPNAARLFVDFVLSKEGAEMISSFFRIPSRIDVVPWIPELKGIKVTPWDSRIVDEYTKYQKIYREVLMKR